jgi:lipopolysaccharide/colanic/teichoic acid biosynthesis glycosyltransferase
MVITRTITENEIMLKRLFDLIVATLGIALTTPIMIGIAIWIKIDSPGSIFFRQVRVGRFGKEFRIYKFRTMVSHAEKLGAQITIGQDPRITRSGEFLRKHKLDEIPQLINVLKGEMSFVGPRPEVPRYVALYSPEQYQVLNISPGITDLASLQFRNENEILAQAKEPEEFYIQEIMPHKIKLNLQYVRIANLATDIRIIIVTVLQILVDSMMPSDFSPATHEPTQFKSAAYK